MSSTISAKYGRSKRACESFALSFGDCCLYCSISRTRQKSIYRTGYLKRVCSLSLMLPEADTRMLDIDNSLHGIPLNKR